MEAVSEKLAVLADARGLGAHARQGRLETGCRFQTCPTIA